MAERKIVFFLVEGKSDMSALERIFDVIYDKYEIEFKILHGDITADERIPIKDIEQLLLKQVDLYLQNHEEIEVTDILKVIQIIDTDGAFIPPEKVKQSSDGKTSYTDEYIFAKNRERLIARNIRKREIVYKLRKSQYMEARVEGTFYKMDYQVYFMSRNLEHALYGYEGDYTDEEKEDFAFEFTESFVDREGEFIKYLNHSDIMIEGDYQETWNYIFTGINSLHRGSNLHLIFKDIMLELDKSEYECKRKENQ